MSEVANVMTDYLAPPVFDAENAGLGPGKRGRGKRQGDFHDRLQAAQVRYRRWAQLCAVLLVVMFGVVLFVSVRHFEQLAALGPKGFGSVSGIFGLSAGGAVVLMMRLAREIGRAEQLMVLLSELHHHDADALKRIIQDLLSRWYGLSSPDAKRNHVAVGAKPSRSKTGT